MFEQLVAASDVFVTNISEDALAQLRITYEDIRALKPDVVYLTLPAFGSEGPYRAYRTWGHNLAAAAGIDHLIGWPDREPVQLGFAYPDFVSAQAATAAVIAALMRRDATGEGARLEVWQYAMALACLGPTVVAAQLSGAAPGASGNRAEGRAPHALYPARETTGGWRSRCETDAMWDALCGVQGLESLGTDARFATVALRLEHEDALDDVVAAWTATRTDWEAATELQSVGVAASPVLDAWDVVADPHLAARDFFHALPHARFARDLVFGQAVRLSETPLPRRTRRARVRRAHPRRAARAHRLRRAGDRAPDRRRHRAGDGTRRRRVRAALPALDQEGATPPSLGHAHVRPRHRDDAHARGARRHDGHRAAPGRARRRRGVGGRRVHRPDVRRLRRRRGARRGADRFAGASGGAQRSRRAVGRCR